MAKFQKGVSGNPKGRTKGVTTRLTTEARRILEDSTPAVLQAAVDAALAGDTTAQRVVLGLALPKKIRTTLALPALDTPEGVANALAMLADSAARGTVEAEEARSIAAVVEAAGRQIDLNSRLSQFLEVIVEQISAESTETAAKIINRLGALAESPCLHRT